MDGASSRTACAQEGPIRRGTEKPLESQRPLRVLPTFWRTPIGPIERNAALACLSGSVTKRGSR